MDMRKYKLAALIGVIIMGMGAFMSCLAASEPVIITGDALLIVSIGILLYAFSHWQP